MAASQTHAVAPAVPGLPGHVALFQPLPTRYVLMVSRRLKPSNVYATGVAAEPRTFVRSTGSLQAWRVTLSHGSVTVRSHPTSASSQTKIPEPFVPSCDPFATQN